MRDRETILIADDDPSLLTVLGVLLQEEGYRVFKATDGAECLRLAYEVHPALILLDIMMPNKDGNEACRRLREISDVPIIMLTAVSAEKQKMESFAGGADDFVTKPFNNDELVARIRAILRRSRPSTTPRQAFEDERLIIDFDARQVRVDGDVIPLSAKEWRLLECLVKHQGRVASRETLLHYAWGEGYEHEYNYLKVFISHLRRKIGDSPDHPHYIHTERDMGYRFDIL
ncbi:MAG: response regulator transcription factor [Chloroflexi bacterium]|nr:response regulator transcription factor [Chloroflexota bacterium]